MQPLLGLLIIAAAVVAIFRRVDVRLVLVLAAMTLGAVSGDVSAVVRKFLETFSNPRFVVPICCAMGFAQVLRLTECDQHLVQALIRPLRRVRPVLIPGAVIIGFLVNVPVISQTSTAAAVGPVLVPLLLAARLSPVTTGAALLLGASVGGELLNPGAPELNTVAEALNIHPTTIVQHVVPLLLVQLSVATVLFWALSIRAERRYRTEHPLDQEAEKQAERDSAFHVNWFKALVPLVPLALLFPTGPPFNVEVPWRWFGDSPTDKIIPSRLIGAAMLIGVAVAALASPRQALGTARAFFEGAGYAFTNIISLIVAATCFGEGVERVGLARYVGALRGGRPVLLIATAGVVPLAFAWLSGSGMAATQSLFKFFIEPAGALGLDQVSVGALVSVAAAAGRTMSPVAAVTLLSATLTGTEPGSLIRRVSFPLLAGAGAAIIAAAIGFTAL